MSSTLYQLFADTADRQPDAPAVELPDKTLTYRQVRNAAEAVAEQIRDAHPPVARVGLFATRSTVAFAGYLAALRLGAAVVPFHPDFPAARNRRVRELADVDVVVADAALWKRDEQGWADGLPVVLLTDEDVLAAAPSGHLPPYDMDPDRPAYVLFTSGTTGRPKGIPIRHRHVLPFVEHSIARYEVGPGCRMSHTFDLTFDPSVYDLFVTWGGGAVLVVPNRSEMFSPAEYLARRELTHWFSVPSAVSVSAQLGQLPTGRTNTLRYSHFGGEQFTYGQARTWHAVAPDSLIDNSYGPSEVAVGCSTFRLPRDPPQWPSTSNDTVPIGRVFDHLESLIIEDTGELCVRGAQRFDGYLDPQDDAGRFLDHSGAGQPGPEHYFRTGDRVRIEGGQLVHLGRLDDQVKIRGVRVEPGDVETALRQLPQVHDAVVVVAGRDGVCELVACYTGQPVPRRDLLRALRTTLPIHLVPRRFLHLETLPLNSNGKTDRGALRALAGESLDGGHP
ncbi:AMP-binding protein [Streptomyces sp. NBC_01614]|uniref:AMP-binding protein n=1 Tax=Streptomyces sp. NBC_01614 TaxID=2975897 RepID=UPI0038651FE7